MVVHRDSEQQLLDAVAQLTIEVRHAVTGLQGGTHRSPVVGPSVEFSEHNRYHPGDDVRNIDWKALARTDRYYIKAHEKEASLSCLLLLDCSGSMAYTGTGADYSKLAYARVLLGAIAHILLRQGDSVGLLAFADDRKMYVPPRRNPGHLATLLAQMQSVDCKESTGTGFSDALSTAARVVGHNGFVVMASDMWTADSQVEMWLGGMAARAHNIALFHVLCPDELHLPFSGTVHFDGMEGEGGMSMRPLLIRDAYMRAVEAERHRWRSLAARFAFSYIDAVTDEVPASVLTRLVRHVKRQRKNR